MTMSVPDGMPDSGETKMTGTMAWNPTALDMTMSDGGAKAKSGDDEPKRMIWVDGVAYMDMGDFEGKKWGKLDLKAAAKEAGDEEMTKAVTAGLDDAEQDRPSSSRCSSARRTSSTSVPARSTAYAPSTTRLPDGRGGLKGAKVVNALKPEDREKLLANVKKSGIKGYDYDVWVNSDDLPVRMTVDVKTPLGTVSTSASYSDYGTTTAIKAPPASETTDLLKILKEAAARSHSSSI